VIAGAKGWFDIREYIQGHHNWFQLNGMFINEIPADDTIARIISTIEPEQFHECFLSWMQSVHTLTEGRASTIHMVSAYASSNKLVLGQIKTDQKSNEITAIHKFVAITDEGINNMHKTITFFIFTYKVINTM